jgi:hypothetical protein
MRPIVIALACVLLFVGNAHAEDSYRLRVPSAAEYISAIPPIMNNQVDADGQTPYNLVSLLENEFHLRYAETANAKTLSDAYEALGGYGFSSWSNYMPYTYATSWNLEIVQRWLKENPTDFDRVKKLNFDRYVIDVQPQDFDGDGKGDWLLEVSRSNGIYHDYWAAVRDRKQPGGYQFIMLPIPYRDSNFWPAQEEWGGASLVRIADLNMDGKPEYLFETSAAIPASGVVGADFRLYVVGWQNNKFQILTVEPKQNEQRETVFNTVIPTVRESGGDWWKFKNIDSDAALELVETVQYADNWGCKRSTETVYDWDGIYYRQIIARHEQENSVNCALRNAQEAMWNKNYGKAAQLYELTLRRYWSLSAKEQLGQAGQFAGYAQERLVLAYALSGHMAQARMLLSMMERQGALNHTIAGQLIKVKHGNVLQLCQAAYNFIASAPSNRSYRGLIEPEIISEEYHMWVSSGASPGSPEKVGCDVGRVAVELLNKQTFSTQTTPIQQIATLGIGIRDWQHMDLNLDGIEDWVIGLQGVYKPFFFLSAGSQYLVSETDFFPFYEEKPLKYYRLPGMNGRAWVSIRSSGRTVECIYAAENAVDGCDPRELIIWHVQDNKLVELQRVPICEYKEWPGLLVSSDSIYGCVVEDENVSWDERVFNEAVYHWDSQKGQYVLPPVASATPSPTTSNAPSTYYNIDDLNSALFYKKDFGKAIDVAHWILINRNENDLIAETRYKLAFALEMLNRKDEALAEYVALYSQARDTAWGKLAALHLQPA